PSLLHAPPTPGVSALSLHDALPISVLRLALDVQLHVAFALRDVPRERAGGLVRTGAAVRAAHGAVLPVHAEVADGGHLHRVGVRSEEHTSELQSRENLVCRLLLEKK